MYEKAAITKVMIMTLLYNFLLVAARLACVGDEEVIDVDWEVGTGGGEDDDVARMVDNDDGTALVGLLIGDSSVELLDAV